MAEEETCGTRVSSFHIEHHVSPGVKGRYYEAFLVYVTDRCPVSDNN